MRKIAVISFIFCSFINMRTIDAKYVPEQRYGETLCKKDGFHCLKVNDKIKKIKIVKKNKTITIKKALPDTWEELFPDEKIRTLVMKLNRLNITLQKNMILAVPKETAGKMLASFSPFPKWIVTPAVRGSEEPSGSRREKVLIFDPALLAFAAYKSNGELAKWGPAIGGMDRCLDTWRRCRTIVGTYKIIAIGDADSKSHIYPLGCPKKEPCAPMPWYVKFEKKYGYGFHASEKMMGRHASHGCVRLFLDDAKWLNQNFVEIGTMVITKKYPRPPRN